MKHKTPDQLAKARELAIELAKMAANTRCSNVIVIDVVGKSPITDFFVIGTGTSARQMRSVCDDCDEAALAQGAKAVRYSGYGDNSPWICVDFIDVVVHLFTEEARAYYDFDNLWADASRITWNDAAPAVPVI